jgi:hypothetical protein
MASGSQSLNKYKVLLKFLDENIGAFSSNDSISDSNYTHLVTGPTQVIIDSESMNCSDKQEEENINVGFGGLSNKFVWKNIGSFPAS